MTAYQRPWGIHMTGSGQIPPGYNTPIPESIMTPDVVKSRIGRLEFADGVPTTETASLLWDHLDFIRGVEVFLNCIPAASPQAMNVGMQSLGLDACHRVAIADGLLDSNGLFLTGNTDTVYVSAMIDLERDGPTVVEIPDGFHVARTPSWVNWLILRGFLAEGRPDAATAMFKEGLRVYPLSKAHDPPEMEFVSITGKVFNTIHANDITFYDEVDAVIQVYGDRRWTTGFLGGDYRWLATSTTGSRPFPARAGSSCSASTAHSRPGSTRPGDPATSK